MGSVPLGDMFIFKLFSFSSSNNKTEVGVKFRYTSGNVSQITVGMEYLNARFLSQPSAYPPIFEIQRESKKKNTNTYILNVKLR